ncbi:class I SAM-dependent methyltransferase [Agaribacter marinus]|nr:class I SAM-dependent methyltransferase [Agaribacter marinus]
MNSAMTAGTKGYEKHVSRFVQISRALDFHEVCKDFLSFLPNKKSNVLDVGSGAGQNAVALDKIGFNVTAIEPLQEFVDISKAHYKNTSVNWLKGSLPDMDCLKNSNCSYDFVLIDGVWHHLNQAEREEAAKKLSNIINRRGKCAVSLRNGPAGMGSLTYPIDLDGTITLFERYNFRCIFSIKNQNSILPNKEQVKWARIVLEKY